MDLADWCGFYFSQHIDPRAFVAIICFTGFDGAQPALMNSFIKLAYCHRLPPTYSPMTISFTGFD